MRRAGSRDGRPNNSAKFAVFRDNGSNGFRRKQGTLSDDFKPDDRFVQFFENDFEFVNKVGPAFGAPRLTILAAAAVPDRRI